MVIMQTKVNTFFHTVFFLFMVSCSPAVVKMNAPKILAPEGLGANGKSTDISKIQWKSYFKDPFLVALIDSAIAHNQELKIFQQEIEIKGAEIKSLKGEYLPTMNLALGAGVEKAAQFTRNGAVDEQLHIIEEQPIPKPLQDYQLGVMASWEVDIWRKLRNAKDAATFRYLASIVGKNLLVTKLVSEVADTYYELLALDNLLAIVNQNLVLQSSAVNSVKLQKNAARASQLAVNRFEAQLLKTKNLQYELKQKITEAENKISLLTGSAPKGISRNLSSFLEFDLDSLQASVPAELLENRPDLKQAELELLASNLDVAVAKANFYPSLSIRARMGYNAFNPEFLLNPQSILYNLTGDIIAPLVNRNAIKAKFMAANAKQIQALTFYEQMVLNAFIDVQNNLAKINNYQASLKVKAQEVDILYKSVSIATNLFNNARADYVEVLLTQEEALDAKLELYEIKAKTLKSRISLYRALGGGWN